MSKLVKRGVGGALHLGKKAVVKTVEKSKSKSDENIETVCASPSPTTSQKSNHSDSGKTVEKSQSGSSSPLTSQRSNYSTDSDDSDISDDEDVDDDVAEEDDVTSSSSSDDEEEDEEVPTFNSVMEKSESIIKRVANPEFREILKELIKELRPVFGKGYQFYKEDPDLSGKWRYMPLALFVLFHDLTKTRRTNFVKRIVDEGNGTLANKDDIWRLAKYAMIVTGVYHVSHNAKNKEDIVKYFQEERHKFITEGNPVMSEMSVVPESPDDIILYHLETQTNIPTKGMDKTRFIMFLDHNNKNLVICFRGTSNAMDALVDLDAKGAPFPSGEGFQRGSCNHGTIKGAKWFFKNALYYINKGLQKHPGYGIMITGHSLGAMMAITVTMELVAGIYGVCTREPDDCTNSCDNSHLLPGVEVLCTAFAPAPVYRRDPELTGAKHLDEEMKEKGIIKIAVHKHDIVPRFSVENLKIFVRILNIINKHVSSRKNMARYIKKRLKNYQSVTDFPGVLTVDTEELLEKLDEAVLDFDREDNPRVHPGEVFLVSPLQEPKSWLSFKGKEAKKKKEEKKNKKEEKKKREEEGLEKLPNLEKYRVYKLKDGKAISNNMEIASKDNIENHKAPGYLLGLAKNVKRLSKEKKPSSDKGRKGKAKDQLKSKLRGRKEQNDE